MPPRLRTLAATALLLLTSACSSTRVHTDFDPDADFRAYRTFGFFEELGTDEPQYETLLSRHLRKAATRELEARGYTLAPQPDLLVNFHVRERERVRRATTYSYSVYYRYRRECRWPYDPWYGYPRETVVHEYTEGTVHVDLVDRAQRQVVWEAVVTEPVSESDREDPRRRANEVVARAFADFPPK